jgi:butyrate kinase
MPDVPNAEKVAGHADILVCPGIDSANAIYKTIAAMNKHGLASLAGITVGFPVSYIVLSRSDTLETRLNSIALCSIYSQRAERNANINANIKPKDTDKTYRVLAVNPGSTSIKLAVYENEKCINESETEYEIPLNSEKSHQQQQIEQLVKLAEKQVKKCGFKKIDAVAGRGGFLPRPPNKLSGGTYIIAEKKDGQIIVDQDIVSGVMDYPEMEHASNFGIPVAAQLAQKLNVPAFTVDPVVVDEFDARAELSGYADITRKSTSHALSIRAAVKHAAIALDRNAKDINLVVAHLGGGITIATVCKGRIIDNSIALLGGGPFTPQRAGQIPTGDLIDLCFSGSYTRRELIKRLTKTGGLRSYLGEDRMEKIEIRIAEGDEKAKLVVDAMIYKIVREIGAAFAGAGCDVEAIVLTGGLTRSKIIKSSLSHSLNRLAPVMVFEGSLEMQALAAGAIDVLAGNQKALRYELPDEISTSGEI